MRRILTITAATASIATGSFLLSKDDKQAHHNDFLSKGSHQHQQHHGSSLPVIDANSSVSSLISEHDVVVFSKGNCPYCVKAKKLLQELNIPFVAVELDQLQHDTRTTMTNELIGMTNVYTVPQIFINRGEFIGGCDDLFVRHSRGELVFGQNTSKSQDSKQ